MNVKNREIYENLILRHVNANDLKDLVVKKSHGKCQIIKTFIFYNLRTNRKFSYFWFMTTLQIDIIEPKAVKLLEDLAAMNLITIQTSKQERLKNLLTRLRVQTDNMSIEDISKEVEIVRSERYARTKK